MSQRSFPPEVLEALKRGNKIEAIKLLRAAAKVGLAEAKSVVDALQNAPAGSAPAASPPAAKRPNVGIAHKHHAINPNLIRRPGLSPGEVPHSGGGGMGWVVVLVGGLLLAWFFLR
ncbi:MAG TPA: hypothetical protein VFD95_10180 [Usitatibacter sp.]|jgi:hypothetical protein|nr:hypothetical protein [Usitatibacter sp.]